MILAIDVGGTKLAAARVSPDGDILETRRAATPQDADAETLWQALRDLIGPLSDGVTGVGVGCGGPMAWPAGVVSPLNIPGWRGFPLRARLSGLFPGIPVRVHNDAICLAVAEHWRGAGRGVRDMLGMVVSTGVGGGLILGGRLVNGGTGNAGHIGHVIVEPDGGPACGCGGHGCLEAVARGPALTTWALTHGWTPRTAGETPPDTGPSYGAESGPHVSPAAGRSGGPAPGSEGAPHPSSAKESGPHLSSARESGPYPSLATERGALPSDPPRGALPSCGSAVTGAGPEVAGAGPAVTGAGSAGAGAGPGMAGARSGGVRGGGAGEYWEERTVTARMLAEDARAGDEAAVKAMRRAGRALGIAIASATHLCDLDLVTIGGGLSQAGEPLFGPLEEALREHARMEFARRVRVVPAALGQEAGLIGAAALILASDTY